MNILWYTNVPLPQGAAHFNIKGSVGGGWMIAQAELLKNSGVQLSVLHITAAVKEICSAKIDGIFYIFAPAKNKSLTEIFERVISQVKPQLVHVQGTEYIYNTSFLNFCNERDIPCVVSLQGIMSECAKHYQDGLPHSFKKINPAIAIMNKLYYADSVQMQTRAFQQQGESEIAAVQQCKYVIGRTHWDKAWAESVNKSIVYYHVNENLRACFYTQDQWCYEQCEKQSIFISQGFYPIKGFHSFIAILPALIKKYPSLKIYVGGTKPYTLNNQFLDIFVDYFFEYQRYIKRLIKKNNLESYITYLGPLSAEEMKKQYLNCNLFLSCATLENSPNSVGEAMILGTPIVASNVGGTATMLQDKQEGLLYDFFSPQSLIDHISAVLDNSELAQQLGQNAKAKAEKTHDTQVNCTNLMQVYKQIIGE